MRKAEFESEYAKRSGLTVEQFREIRVALPCGCTEGDCPGWAAVRLEGSAIAHHLAFSLPDTATLVRIQTEELEALASGLDQNHGFRIGPDRVAVTESLPTFTASEWFPLKGRGYVAAVSIDRDCEKAKLLETFRRCVIDGREYEVTGVESTCLHTIRKGSPIGLLVKERKFNIMKPALKLHQYFCGRCGYERQGLLDGPAIGIGGYSWSCPRCGTTAHVDSREIVFSFSALETVIGFSLDALASQIPPGNVRRHLGETDADFRRRAIDAYDAARRVEST